jgi:hypothetical protein
MKDSGNIMWHDNGSVIHLKTNNTDLKYKVGENTLWQLDTEGNIIEGEMRDLFSLKKVK